MAGGSTLTDSEKLAILGEFKKIINTSFTNYCQLVILESDAEHLMLPIDEAPPTGYASIHMGGRRKSQ